MLLLGCGTDTFTSGDGSVDGSADGNAMDGIATSDTGADVRTDGPTCVWCPQMSPTTHDLLGVSGVTSNNAVIVVGNGVAYWWSGSWNAIPVSPTTTLRAVSMFDPNNIWAAGNDTTTGGLLLTGSSGALAPPSTPILNAAPQYNAVARNPTIGIAVGTQNGSNTFVYSPNGSSWSYGDGTTSYFGLDAEGSTNAIGVGSNKVATFKGSWFEIALSGTHYAVAGNANQGWIAGAGGELMRYTITNSMITTTMMTSGTTEDLHGIRVRPSGDVYAVGRKGTIVFLKSGTTTAMVQPSGTMQDLNAIWGDANGLWVVGSAGTILRHP